MGFLDKALEVATAAAKEAGRIQLKYYENGLEVGIKKGNIRNIVTNADMEADAAIRKAISAAFPDHGIITEEASEKKGNHYVWHIDPVDGTANYSRKGRYFCVSIALAKGDDVLVGVIFNPVFNELYKAVQGKGAFMNCRRIGMASTKKFELAVMYVDLCNDVAKRGADIKMINKLKESKSIRVLGSGALAICDVASGIADGYAGMCGASWDYAAAALIAREAGGVAKSPEGKEWTPRKGKGIIVASPGICKQIIARMKE